MTDISKHDQKLLEALHLSSEVETRFFTELLRIGGPHEPIRDEDTRCEEKSDPVALCRHPVLSISVITYNQEKFLRETLMSLVQQKVDFEYEILVAEDASTDATRDIALKFQEEYPDKIRVLFSNKNIGAKANARRALLHARGRYLAFCEGDDFWVNPNKLQLQVAFLEQHPEFGLVHGNANRVDSNSKVLAEAFQSTSYKNGSIEQIDLCSDILSGRRSVITCTAMLRTDILRKLCCDYPLLFSTKFRLGDVQTWLGISSVSKVKYLSETLASYRYSLNSSTARGNPLKRLQFLADACVVEALSARCFSADKKMQETAYSRFLYLFVSMAFQIRNEFLLASSLDVIKSINIPCVPSFLVKTLYCINISSVTINYLYRISRRINLIRRICSTKMNLAPHKG